MKQGEWGLLVAFLVDFLGLVGRVENGDSCGVKLGCRRPLLSNGIEV